MAVKILVDSAAGLSRELADENDIAIVDLHVVGLGSDAQALSTSGLSALELAAAYGRYMERSDDDGVVAIHLAKELSSTWSAASTAAAVFPQSMRVIDAGTAGMAIGMAALEAARLARLGASVDECYSAASSALQNSETWLYVRSTEELRKSGRMAPGTAVLSTALLATKPIFSLRRGKLELVGKTRTQAKAFARLVDVVSARAEAGPVKVFIQHHGAAAEALQLQKSMEFAMPGVEVTVVPLTDVLALHAGPGAIGVSAFYGG